MAMLFVAGRERYERVSVSGRIQLTGNGVGEAASPVELGCLLLPLTSQDAEAAVFIPDGYSSTVLHNGLPFRAGMLLVRHGDRLDVGDRTYWLSSRSEAVRTAYAPEIHGAEIYCLRTKARLRAGELVVICPGGPGRACGMLYKAAAWDVMLPCHHCQFDPRQPAWEPPEPTLAEKRSEIDELMRLVGQGRD